MPAMPLATPSLVESDKENAHHGSLRALKQHAFVKPAPLAARSVNVVTAHPHSQNGSGSVLKPVALPAPSSARGGRIVSIFSKKMGAAQRVVANTHVSKDDSDSDGDGDISVTKSGSTTSVNTGTNTSTNTIATTASHTACSAVTAAAHSDSDTHTHLTLNHTTSSVGSGGSTTSLTSTLAHTHTHTHIDRDNGTVLTPPAVVTNDVRQIAIDTPPLAASVTSSQPSPAPSSGSSIGSVTSLPSAGSLTSLASTGSGVSVHSESETVPLEQSVHTNSSINIPNSHTKSLANRQLQLHPHINTHNSSEQLALPVLAPSPAAVLHSTKKMMSPAVNRTAPSSSLAVSLPQSNVPTPSRSPSRIRSFLQDKQSSAIPAPSIVPINHSLRSKQFQPQPQTQLQSQSQVLSQPIAKFQSHQHQHTHQSVQQQPQTQQGTIVRTQQPQTYQQQLRQASAHSSSGRPAGGELRTIGVNGKRYYVLDKIGKGGTSQVYKVMTTADQHCALYALKVVELPLNTKSTEQQLINFKNEIRMMEKMRHVTQCIQLIEYEEKVDHERNKQMLLMILELGTSDLSTFIQRNKVLHPIKLRDLWLSIIECVDVCHRSGILHRDLKPANFVYVDGVIKLLDFGIAASMGTSTTDADTDGDSDSCVSESTCVVSDHMTGTINYMSPESLDAHTNIDKRYHQHRASDVWALGCILYQLVYGQAPFAQYQSMMAKMKAICDDRVPINFPAVDSAGRSVSLELLDVLQWCLQRNPQQRASIDQLLSHPFVNLDSHNTAADRLCTDRARVRIALRSALGREPSDDELARFWHGLQSPLPPSLS